MGDTNLYWFAILSVIFASAFSFTFISRIGGWASLAEPYRISEPFSGRQWKFESGQMCYLTGYNHCLTVGADPRGLYLSIPWPLRISHPPLFIPWRDIGLGSKTFLGVKYVELRLGRETPIPFRISNRLAQKLKSAAAASWPMESIA